MGRQAGQCGENRGIGSRSWDLSGHMRILDVSLRDEKQLEDAEL